MHKLLWWRNSFNMSKRISMKGQLAVLSSSLQHRYIFSRSQNKLITTHSKERHFRQKHVITEYIFVMDWHLQIVKSDLTSKTFITVLNILQQLPSLLFALEKHQCYQSDIKTGKVATFGNKICSELFKNGYPCDTSWFET